MLTTTLTKIVPEVKPSLILTASLCRAKSATNNRATMKKRCIFRDKDHK